ncbi:FxsA family protein [Colwellia sp. MB02u-18]|uniref:FxsA family protein n=1 Tax=unclassified Colwellia TaxID=196834 RepID=UPI0015F42992|nr:MULTISPECIES: FxsA family protein [unclassified Colwellia]MBA6224651.1 FxsA family protein [Colwellia sp. MB3u-45]MBA6268037.1 FxsA family protein [Colwellia sp. MB3u-43]MBA6322489.1 FxsA family protein [Colwellia sp. MB02u-19]MBA6326067.1 FxsA family protein [Colwellia sp. MB02u-18]MBA6331526.1 FxsA family protein [Colwellia sp. MB02u-12]
MFRLLFVLFIIIPIIEIFVLIQVGAVLGVWPTIGMVIFTAWLGAKYVRQQGISTLNSVQTKMAQGQMPSDEIVTALMLLVAGVLLVTPGFVTDFLGLSLLIPAVRHTIAASVMSHISSNNANQQGFQFHSHSHGQSQNQDDFSKQPESPFQENLQPPHEGQTLDGEFERKD